MLKAIRKEIHTTSAALDARWNWRGIRPVVDEIIPTENNLPDTVRDFLYNLGAATDGIAITYGGALNDCARGIIPNDYDTYLMAREHPLETLKRVERWARRKNYQVEQYPRRVRLLWKRLIVHTPNGKFDIGCLQGNSPKTFLHNLAGEADVGPCARSAGYDKAFIARRCLLGEEKDQLIFRPTLNPREQFRHLNRWLKYAVDKYPARHVEYQSAEDQTLFTDLNALRDEIIHHRRQTQQPNCLLKGFEPYRPLIPGLYAQLQAASEAWIKKN